MGPTPTTLAVVAFWRKRKATTGSRLPLHLVATTAHGLAASVPVVRPGVSAQSRNTTLRIPASRSAVRIAPREEKPIAVATTSSSARMMSAPHPFRGSNVSP